MKIKFFIGVLKNIIGNKITQKSIANFECSEIKKHNGNTNFPNQRGRCDLS